MTVPRIPVLVLVAVLLAGCDGEAATSTVAAPVDTPTLPPPADTPTLAVATLAVETVRPTNTMPRPTNTLAPPTDTPTPAVETAMPTNTVPAPTATVPPVEGSPTPAGQCLLKTLDQVTVYTRPHPEAEVFASLPAGDSVLVSAITPQVWIGFDPGVAQAPNVGPFRLRWIPTSPAVVLEGGTCNQLPVIEGPPPGVCFAMVHGEMPVLSAPDPAAEVVAGLSADDYAATIGKSGDQWYQVDLSVGSEGLDQIGWITGYIDFNGPCQDLPEVAG